jgi:hypothetical protein
LLRGKVTRFHQGKTHSSPILLNPETLCGSPAKPILRVLSRLGLGLVHTLVDTKDTKGVRRQGRAQF